MIRRLHTNASSVFLFTTCPLNCTWLISNNWIYSNFMTCLLFLSFEEKKKKVRKINKFGF